MRTNQTTMTFLTNLARAQSASEPQPPSPTLPSTPWTAVNAPSSSTVSAVVLNNTVGEGTHILIPWLQKPYIFDIRTRHHTFSSISGTKDLQMVNLTLRVLSRPEVNQLPSIFKTLGLEYDEKVLPSIGNEVLKALLHTEFSKAVEEKQVAQQEAERSRFVVAKAEQEQRAAVIRAEGESESAKMISEATTGAGMG
ncbi:putative prohibitin, Band 7 domain-containing protein [Helianthus annuus]|nr:putative prohibitin, Band 7 domain-containing protein [Helianthus annuus]